MYVVLRVCAYLEKANLVWFIWKVDLLLVHPSRKYRLIGGRTAHSADYIQTKLGLCLMVGHLMAHLFLDIQSAVSPTHLSSLCIIYSIFAFKLGGSRVMLLTAVF